MNDYERFGDYQPAGHNNAGLALTFLFIGLGAGALLGILFAPKRGRHLRRALRRRYEDARDAFEDLGEQASDVIEKGAGWASAAKERVSPLGRVIRRS